MKWKVVLSKSSHHVNGKYEFPGIDVEADEAFVCPMGGGHLVLKKGEKRVFLAPLSEVQFCQVVTDSESGQTPSETDRYLIAQRHFEALSKYIHEMQSPTPDRSGHPSENESAPRP